MKTLALPVFLALAFSLTPLKAQEGQQEKDPGSISQRAEIKSKKLGIALDLNKDQIDKVAKAEKTKLEAFKELRSTREHGSGEKGRRSRFMNPETQIKFLDLRLAYQNEMKSILSPDQYTQWKKMNRHAKTMHRQKRHPEGRQNRGGSMRR